MVLVVYYSRTGNTKKVAADLGTKIQAEDGVTHAVSIVQQIKDRGKAYVH